MTSSYHLGLLYLVKLLIDADGFADENELNALRLIKNRENISDQTFQTFEESMHTLKERDVYDRGIDLISQCSQEEKLQAFATLYRLAEVDGCVHVKEIKLLLYSIRTAGLEFDAVVNYAKGMSAMF